MSPLNREIISLLYKIITEYNDIFLNTNEDRDETRKIGGKHQKNT